MPAEDPRPQQQQRYVQRVVGTQIPYQYSATPVAATQCASRQTGVGGLHRGIQAPAVNVQAARTTPRTQQEQWLIDAQPDLQGTPVTTVPAISAKQGTVGAAVRPRIELLVPRDVWRLRALPPLQRYIAYHHMVELGCRMSQCGQASEEYLKLWNRIVNVQTSLMEREMELANKFKENTAETRASWSQLVAFQTVETPVNWEMRVAYKNYRDRATACGTPAEDLAVESQPSTSGQVLEQQKPDTWQKPVPKPQTSISSEPTVTSSVPVETIRPDQVKHPLDTVSVPPYPGELEDFTPHEVTGRYKCNHQFETGDCCTEGVTKERKRASISRDKSAWKRKMEELVKKGDLDKSHITWKTEQSPKRSEDQTMKHAEKERLRGEKKADASAKKEARKERSKKWREQPHNANDAGAALGPILAPNSLEQDVASTSEVDSELSPEEQAADAEAAFQEEVAKKLKKYEWDIKRCRLYERRKKWPNWPRFNEYWEVKHLEAQGFQLSPEQIIISKGDEPSGIPDKNPAFVKKKAEEMVPTLVQEPVDAEESSEVDDSNLDDLFEDADEAVE
ncbi:uncharacterized protein J4E84_011021 [Alternaria hordeiaustralica]|uniref:uncharacterized protein n=1 Tax=Alternaria hordeiaustralica TaxID=1187925 RepID=UPI0020C405BE|nr:uncharacterized protein J4E84_011021 [Alternaria hordeiaustralica]KAI4673495.1 hypothetical protein J4E84_011021 [Alternaria hordeiaustralica]